MGIQTHPVRRGAALPHDPANNRGTDTKPEASYKVPNLLQSFINLGTARWIQLRDAEESGAIAQMCGECMNMGLVCALLLTVFVPLYYSEVSRGDIPDDGFTIDVQLGWLAQRKVQLSRDVLHGCFDVLYFMAMIQSLFGTFISVFFVLAANECVFDLQVAVLRQHLGPLSLMPYMFCQGSIICFAVAAITHMVLVPRTLPAALVKIVLAILMSTVFVYGECVMVQGLYIGRAQELRQPVAALDDATIVAETRKFLARPDDSQDKSLPQLLDHLRGLQQNAAGYRPPLTFQVRIKAAHAYMEQMAAQLGVSVDMLHRLHKMSSS